MKNEALGVGGLAVWEGVLGEGEELVVAVALAVLDVSFSFSPTLFLCSSFLAFGLWWWFDFLSEDSHVVQCVGVGSDVRVENVQRGTVFGVKRRL